MDLPEAVATLGASTVIASLGCLVMLRVFERRSPTTVRWVGGVLVCVLCLGGLYWLLDARKLTIKRHQKLAYIATLASEKSPGGDFAAEFTPPETGNYLVLLPNDLPSVDPPARENFSVECVVEDNSTKVNVMIADGRPRVRRYSIHRLIVGQSHAIAGYTYQISLKFSPAYGVVHASTQISIIRDPLSLTEGTFGAAAFGGIGESLWLLAYGTFVATAVHFALGRPGTPRQQKTTAMAINSP